MDTLTAVVSWPSAPFTESLVRNALLALPVPPKITQSTPHQFPHCNLIQWSTYDTIDHELTHLHRDKVLSSSYIFRKALIRKHFLSRCIHSYVTKLPGSVLKSAAPRTFEVEISFADELDEMWADDLWELGEELEDPQKWWILKPGMADRGMGIRLFNSKDALHEIFEEFELSDSEDDEGDHGGTAVVTSQLRHFVIQEYIMNPLLLDPTEVSIIGSPKPSKPQGHKFHLRAYCVASGAIKLYLYNRVLALFSASPYVDPVAETSESGGYTPVDLTPHLTNTSLQAHRGQESVRLLEELIGCHVLSDSGTLDRPVLTSEDVAQIIEQMIGVLAETFKAALQTAVHFQPLPNAFELYGIDFLVSHTPLASPDAPAYQVKLLEVNAEPAIELTGPRLSWILEDLFVAMGKVCIGPFFAGRQQFDGDDWALKETRHNLIKCLGEEVRGAGT